jgi:AcrR family transcriptional regulator
MDTRTRILKAATKLLRKDPGAVRMEDVARAADVSRQALYLHFENRTALLVAATAHLDDELGFQERIQPILQAKTGSQALERMAEFLGSYLPIVQPLIDAFTVGRTTDPAVQAAFVDRTENRRGGCRQIVAWLIRDKELAKDLDAASAEELLMGLTSYELWREWVVAGKMSHEQYLVQLKRLLKKSMLR